MTQSPMPDEVTTARLRLRPYSFADVESVRSNSDDKDWAKFLPVPQPYLRRHAEQFIASQVLLDRVVRASWAIVLAETLIGGINIRFQFEDQVGEIGYGIARPFWGRGYATEAVSTIVREAFATHSSVNRIRAMADARNVASLRVLENAGFLREGVLRQNRVVNSEAVDEVWFGLLRSELGATGLRIDRTA